MARTSHNSFTDLQCLLNATLVRPKNPMLSGEDVGSSGHSSLEFLDLETVGSAVAGRLLHWPDGKPAAPWTAFVSSRLGTHLDNRIAWFRALRVGCARLAESDSPVLNVAGTTAARFLPRATELFATPRIDVLLPKPARKTPSPQEWWHSVQACPPKPRHTGALYRAFLSPRYHLDEGTRSTATMEASIAEADLVALSMADEFLALHVRRGGHVHQMLHHKLTTTRTSPPPVQIAIGANLNTSDAQEELLNAGAVGWYLYASTTTRARIASPASPVPTVAISDSQAFGDSGTADEQYLTHCTRRRKGPWPNQSSDAYLDDLILSRPGSDHSALAALQRIVAGRQLIASGDSIRGGTNVVSFTSVPLEELQELRVFRSHRGRWDFEPYGISIRKSALRALAESTGDVHRLGEVTYGGEEDWRQLHDEERPFFQKSHSESKSGKSSNRIDWSAEQEWRFLGNVDLTQIKPTDAFFFVPTAEDAEELRRLCPWPVVQL